MMFGPPPRWRLPDVALTVASEACLAAAPIGIAPSSGNWAVANTARFAPLHLLEPFTVAKAFWCNGATVGTDSIDIGVYRMTDMSTGRLDLVRSTGAVLSAGTVSVVQEVGTWRVARANVTSGGDSTDRSSAPGYTTASVTLKAGRLCLLSIENSAASAAAPSAITGGPTWTQRATGQYNGTANRLSLYSAVPTVDYTGTIDIAFGATQTGCTWVLDEFSGVDTATNHGLVQVTAVATGSGTTPAATLSAFGSANNATFGVQGHAANTTATPGTGFTELADVGTATPAQAIGTEWRVDNDTSVDFTITSAAWACVGAEIKADASAFVIPPATVGSPDVYFAMTVSGITATFLRVTASAGISNTVGVLVATTTFPLPSNVTPSPPSTATVSFALAGFSSRSLIG